MPVAARPRVYSPEVSPSCPQGAPGAVFCGRGGLGLRIGGPQARASGVSRVVMPLVFACLAPHGGGLVPRLGEDRGPGWPRLRAALTEAAG